ncbi:hypothetical protein [Maricaulis sp.]|uniref:hypothetical protein n=1 Tax=Maricaulis sp. TaxID=1486257 RepID=UPI0026333EC3|nr:hypothetical protein [Maricaulis sp.]
MKNKLLAGTASVLVLAATAMPALADDDDRISALEARIEQLEQTNAQLLQYLEALTAENGIVVETEVETELHHGEVHEERRVVVAIDTEGGAGATAQVHVIDNAGSGGLVGLNSEYSYAVLDHAEGSNTRQLTQLRAMQDGQLNNRVTFGGAITALANYQESNSDTKFGWLMRHPTSANQIGEEVSELVVHSAQLQTTARFTDNITGFVELLYNPEQSFGSGTLTDLNRNQVQVRRAYVLWGNLDESPWYGAIGKMDTPFGLNDTVSPFTNSTVWHSFAGLAYGGTVGYSADGLHVRAMAIQGGAQFRAANTPVEGTNVPSRVNNFAVDANYTGDLGVDSEFMLGASYQHGSPYCQAYPVFHFNPCEENNPAYSVYGRLDLGALRLLGEYARTTDEWPGSAVPIPSNPLSVFEAVETTSWGFGGRYAIDTGRDEPFYLSAEFSTFIAGDEGAPWERQNQWVLGGSYFVTPSVNVFGELIRTEGWVPLNFLSGGNLPDGSSWSESDAETNVITLGIQAAF